MTQRVFEAEWVLFPARLGFVILVLAGAMLLLVGGSWVTVRLAHSLRHLQWREPPRRLKRGELGAAGASVGWEFEDRSKVNIEGDAERDRQIAALSETVKRLSERQSILASVMLKLVKSTR